MELFQDKGVTAEGVRYQNLAYLWRIRLDNGTTRVATPMEIRLWQELQQSRMLVNEVRRMVIDAHIGLTERPAMVDAVCSILGKIFEITDD